MDDGDEFCVRLVECYGGLIFATPSSLRTEILNKSWEMRQCTLVRDKIILFSLFFFALVVLETPSFLNDSRRWNLVWTN